MENVNEAIAANLKRLRAQRRLSLDAVAAYCGVSKSMLGQIERGEVNPTVSTVWKIANGLKVSFTELMARPEAAFEAVEGVRPLLEDAGRYRNFPLFPFDSARRFEMYLIEIEPGGRLAAQPHPPGTQEFLALFAGEVTVRAGAQTLRVGAGGALRFLADCAHEYKNETAAICSMCMVIYYP